MLTGPPLLVVEHQADCGPGLLGEPLRAHLPLHVVRPYLGEALPGPEATSSGEYCGLLVLGGDLAAWEDDRGPWLPATRALIAAAVADALPTLGVCLGAQLLAHATGGRADRGASGLELGLVEVTPLPAAADDPFVRAAGLGAPYVVVQSHGDAVVELPPDAELLVTGDPYPVQGFRVGECAWGVQYHPEVTPEGFAGWAAHHQDDVDPDGVARLERVVAAVEAGRQAQQALAEAHAAGLVAAVRARRAAGRTG